MKKSILASILFIIAAAVLISGCSQYGGSQEAQPHTPTAKEHVLLTPGELSWKPAPASLPAGAEIVVIEGNLSNAEPFIFRLKLPPNYKIAPHTHPAIEHVTVISGTFYFGAGGAFEPDKAKALTAGSVGIFQPGQQMFAYTKGETIIQVHGVGPWGLAYVNPDDVPRKASQQSTQQAPAATESPAALPPPPPASSAGQTSANTIEITASGFSPNSLTIKAGEKVTFVNKDATKHWPASAVHPTHAVYPEPGGCLGSKFDACKGLETGEKFEFTFNLKGSWKYHDHLNCCSDPAFFGTIVVE